MRHTDNVRFADPMRAQSADALRIWRQELDEVIRRLQYNPNNKYNQTCYLEALEHIHRYEREAEILGYTGTLWEPQLPLDDRVGRQHHA